MKITFEIKFYSTAQKLRSIAMRQLLTFLVPCFVTFICVGGHTVGFARCTSFRPHIYNDTNIDSAFAKSLQNTCPRSGNDNVLQPLDYQTRFRFDDKYYQNLLVKKGLLHSDQQLYNGNKADSLAKKYAMKQADFFKDFAKSMIRMGNIKPLTGNNGQIRSNCRKPN